MMKQPLPLLGTPTRSRPWLVAQLMRWSRRCAGRRPRGGDAMWLLGLLTLEQWTLVAAIAVAMLGVARLGLRVIGPNESGLLIKRSRPDLPPPPPIPLTAHAGYPPPL